MFAAFGVSDPGCRVSNEDYFISDVPAGIFILADGMGGVNGGERAARIAAKRLHEFLSAHSCRTGIDVLERGFLEANEAVFEASQLDPDLCGMGTTLIAAIAAGNHEIHICSVGDSRAYLETDGQVTAITRDQTWVAEVGSKLGLSQQALNAHPMRHVLTMAIGCTEELRVHSHLLRIEPGSQVLLCSDGLHSVVDEKIIHDTLLSRKSLDHKCHYLVEAAKANGGPDNITVVLLCLV
jgi:PPM family protein phosphatase